MTDDESSPTWVPVAPPLPEAFGSPVAQELRAMPQVQRELLSFLPAGGRPETFRRDSREDFFGWPMSDASAAFEVLTAKGWVEDQVADPGSGWARWARTAQGQRAQDLVDSLGIIVTSEDPWKRWWHLADCGRGFVKLPVPTGEDRSEWDARFDGVEVDELDPDELQRDWTATWLAELAGRLGFIPRDRFGETADINQLDDDLLQWWVYVRPFVPSSDEVRVAHGSWFRALVAAGVLDADMRRGRFGTHVLAEDGCFCTSLAEKLIDDLMFELGVEHLAAIAGKSSLLIIEIPQS